MVRMKLHILMAEHGITQKQLALITGIRQGTLSGYCSNNYKHIVNLHIDILCTYFDIDISDLIQYKKDTPKN